MSRKRRRERRYPAEVSQRTRPPHPPTPPPRRRRSASPLTVTLRLRGSVLRYAAVTIYAGGERSTSSTVSVIILLLLTFYVARVSARATLSGSNAVSPRAFKGDHVLYILSEISLERFSSIRVETRALKAALSYVKMIRGRHGRSFNVRRIGVTSTGRSAMNKSKIL